MQPDFTRCMPVILQYEGGWSNHPRDPGGVTLEGVIQRVYDGYRDRKGRTRQPLAPAMRGTRAWITERNEIFRLQYWNAIRGDDLPAGIDLFLFDCAVNSGPFQAVKWLQRALRLNDVDGHLGEGTLAALKAHEDHDAVIADMASRRLGMLQNLTTWDAFGKGWAGRVASVRAIAQAWASGSVGPPPAQAHQQQGDAKAYASDVAQPALDAGDSTKLAVGSGSVSAVVDGARDQLAPLAGSSDYVNRLLMALTILGILIAAGALAYSLWASRKAKLAQRAVDGEVMAHGPEGQPA
jgi:lysozyme family protein